MSADSVKLDVEALEFISSWEPKSDVAAFHNGGNILCASTVLSAVYINHVFRKSLKLKGFAFTSTYAAVVFIPSVFASSLHGMFSLRPLLSGNIRCPICIETRSALIQTSTAVLYPLLLAPIACFQFADRYMTVALPSIIQQPKLVFKKVFSILQPYSKKILMIAAAQMVIGAALTHWEIRNLAVVIEKVEKMEKVVIDTVSPEKLEKIKRSSLIDENKEFIMRDKPIPKYAFGLDD